MSPATYNLPTGYRGDSYGPITFRFYNGSGDSINLDGYSGGLQVRQAQDLPVVLQWLTSDYSMLIESNTVTLTTKSGHCMRMMPGNYYYDMQLDLGSTSKTYIKGVLPVEGDITQL